MLPSPAPPGAPLVGSRDNALEPSKAKNMKKGGFKEAPQMANGVRSSNESVDGVIDVVVGDGAGVASDAVVGLDVVQGFDVPGG
jgi:hypothetical protein